jgi:hypothetical protein
MARASDVIIQEIAADVDSLATKHRQLQLLELQNTITGASIIGCHVQQISDTCVLTAVCGSRLF